MDVERLVAMVNDIGNYFASEPDRDAGIAGIANHLVKFWEPRMRKQIIAHLDQGGEGLTPIARVGVERLKANSQAC